ncbi:MAG: UDP-N-acetylmuramoyl-tripeptide--D-alanyl-D-alanine ligase, partial [Paracoccaceae bacterium]
IGMNHPGEIAPLAKMTRPHVALITIVAPAHLAAFESLAGIAEEKASIFQGLEPVGVAVLNGDLEVSDILASEAKRHAETVLSFGESTEVDFRATGVSIRDDCTVVQGQTQGAPVLYKVPVPGRHYAINAMGVLATVAALDLDQALAVAALGRWVPGEGRGARDEIVLDMANAEARFELIDDAYNANPASLAASLEVLAAAETGARAGLAGRGRRVAYIGDMKELGATEAELHRAVADLAAVQNIDVIHCVGPLMQHLYQALPEGKRGRWAETSAEITQGIGQDINAGDVVLVKGSLSMALARVVDALKKMGQAPVKLDG